MSRRPAAEAAPAGLTPAEAVHFDLLQKWRGAMDLVGPGATVPHFVDAAQAVDGLDVHGTWADLGSGAGFPGIALGARHPDATVHLVESRQKRVLFLETVVSTARRQDAGLHRVDVVHGRTEELPGPYDGLVSRAYKAPEDVLDDAARLLAPDGVVVLLLGDRDWAPPAGWLRVEEKRYELPGDAGARRRVVVRRG
ncbi:MAG: class I SAM-dependent methyltransferase [Alphaproteobacteria bacterium]|nr:class I SAM-dependent methyltransferase [Alphaproteobacteria bacterium]